MDKIREDNFSGGDNMWDERFHANKNLYTTQPNLPFAEYLKSKKPGKILLPGDGEGRNGVFAAKFGWEVTTFDYSKIGVKHALELAKLENVQINAIHSSIADFEFQPDFFDAIAMIFLHLPPEIRIVHFPRLMKFLKPGGELFLLGFNKKQINYSSGGPKNVDMLFDSDELKREFQTLKITELKEFQFPLNEGPKHQGTAELIQLIGLRVNN